MQFLKQFFGQQPSPKISPEHIIGQQVMSAFNDYEPLLRLQDDRQLLEVLLPNQEISLHTMILGVDFAKKLLKIDAFSPNLIPPTALIGESICIRHFKGWKKLEITTSVLDWDEDNYQFYVALPKQVRYTTRRSYQRLTIAGKHLLKSHIYPLYGSPWYATVKDISPGGMRIHVQGDLRPHLQKHTLLPKCQLQLDRDISIQCQGLVKTFRYISRPHRATEIGIEFQKMSKANHTDLERFIDYVGIAA